MTDYKHIIVSIAGEPNVGKSSFINKVIGQKICAQSNKKQTTREVVRGISIHNNTQIIFTDTPGIFEKKSQLLEKIIIKNAWNGIKDSDLVCIFIDNRGITKNTKMIISYLETQNIEYICCINKIDIMSDTKKINLALQIEKELNPKEIFMLSSQNSRGMNQLLQYFQDNAQHKGLLYPEDSVTDKNMEFIISDLFREKLFIAMQEEIPYGLHVKTDSMTKIENDKDNPEDDSEIYIVNLTVKTKSLNHKKIIIGKKGSGLKGVIKATTDDIFENYDIFVKLNVFVQVDDKWIDEFENYQLTEDIA